MSEKNGPWWMLRDSQNEKSFMVTISIVAIFFVLVKLILSGVTIEGYISFDELDSGLVAAILTPTLGAYAFRRHTTAKTRNEKAIEFARITNKTNNSE